MGLFSVVGPRQAATMELNERAFQKQDGISLIRLKGMKRRKMGLRYVHQVGLGFKVPREAKEGTYIDKKCPFTGNVSIRGRIVTGTVLKMKMNRTIVIAGECRPLSKTVRFNVLKVVAAPGSKKKFQ